MTPKTILHMQYGIRLLGSEVFSREDYKHAAVIAVFTTVVGMASISSNTSL